MKTTMPLLFASVSLVSSFASNSADWVEKSNQYTQQQIQLASEFQPEYATYMGIAAADGKCSNVTAAFNQRHMQALANSKMKLQQALAKEPLLPVKQDIEILINDVDQDLERNRLNEQYLLPWIDVPQTIFSGLSRLLDDQMPVERQKMAVNRLQCYVGKSDAAPLTEQAKQRFETALNNKQLIGPVKEQIEQALARTETFIQGIDKLFSDKGLAEQASAELQLLASQLRAFVSWAEQTVIPNTRSDFRLPAELYALNLKTRGIDIDPQLLIERAKASYMVTKANMQALAPLVAKKFNIDSSDYRDVIKALKKSALSNEVIEQHYREINRQLEKVIAKEKIVTLPKRDMIMRLASDAEAAGSPAPHMLPPPFINNQGEQGQFVLTTGNPALTGDAAYDDFNFNAVAYTLSAHEGRPGHELQFSAMLEQGVSLARVYYAFNSVNVEGWALYAEGEMLPYLPIEGQLIALQHRLLRNARAMLDPMLNLGLTTKEQAYYILLNEVGFSKAAAKQEVDRYTMRMPGQAGSYFYGFSRLLEIRAEVEIALGEKFDRFAFNNFILNQGLIPPSLMAKAVKEHFIDKQSTSVN